MARHPGLQEVQACPTMTRSMLRLAERLAGLGVTRVVIEATSVIRGHSTLLSSLALPCLQVSASRSRARNTSVGGPETASGRLPDRYQTEMSDSRETT